ncbi:pyridoxamine 5'-phosphate oxidase family protein [Pseudonocardia acaciae]|uniref:pyridoxamine 5'-phosphate oxidase family protein n=1 Tax=Pseudonocardia acaciae TaxID=551276 RepID=UPI0006881217|nr:pyridoxamine 5'-phosphate oxidase family protein [Pseudonocardia acaciae]
MPTTDIDILTEHDCMALLRTASVGRLLFTEDALPAIRPVNFTVTDHRILVPATEGSWAGRLDGVLVAFTADHINPDNTGWSVLAHGTARLVVDPDRALRITIERVTGRRVALTRTLPHPA